MAVITNRSQWGVSPSLMRFKAVSLGITPIGLTWVAGYAHAASTYRLDPGHLKVWGLVLLGVSLVYLFFPYFFEHLIGQHPEVMLTRGRDPAAGVFIVGMACSVTPCVLSFFFALVGGPIMGVYWWSAVSVVFLGVWFWRYRFLLLASSDQGRTA